MSTDAMHCIAGFASTYFNFPLPTRSTTSTRLPLVDHGGLWQAIGWTVKYELKAQSSKPYERLLSIANDPM